MKLGVAMSGNIDNISQNNTVTMTDSYDTGVCAGGRGEAWCATEEGGPGLAETIFWVQLPGNNEISRFNSWASLSLLWSRKKKTKVISKQVSLCFEFSPHLIDSRYNRP